MQKFTVKNCENVKVLKNIIKMSKKRKRSDIVENSKGEEHKSKKSRSEKVSQKTENGEKTNVKIQVCSDQQDSNRKNGGDHKKKKQGSCMKHKKQDKSHCSKSHVRKKRKKAKGKSHSQTDDEHTIESGIGSKNNLHHPKNPQDVSSNWKQFQKTFNLVQKKPKAAKKKVPEDKKPKQDTTEAEPEIWFDDVDEVLIESSKTKQSLLPTACNSANNPLVKTHSFSGVTKIVAIDCEMVGVGDNGEDSMLARVSIVNHYGQCVYDTLVQPREEITDYRTQYSGIRPGDMEKGEEFDFVQKKVHEIIKGRILVGHAIHHDLQVLFLDHPHKKIRDTSKYEPFRKLFNGRIPALKNLADQLLGVTIQEGEHDSIQDAQATMRLYTMYRKKWERELKIKKTIRRDKGLLLKTDSKKTKDATLDSDSEG